MESYGWGRKKNKGKCHVCKHLGNLVHKVGSEQTIPTINLWQCIKCKEYISMGYGTFKKDKIKK